MPLAPRNPGSLRELTGPFCDNTCMSGETQFGRGRLAVLAWIGALACIVCCCVNSHAQLAASPMPMLGGNAQHTGYVEVDGPLEQPQPLWTIVQREDNVVVGQQLVLDASGNIYFDLGYSASPGIVATLFGGSNAGEKVQDVICLNPAGEELWRFGPVPSMSRAGLSVPAILENGSMVIGFRDFNIRSVSFEPPELKWSTELPDSGAGIISSPVVDSRGFAYVAGRRNRKLYKFDSSNGDILWEFVVPTSAQGNGTGSSPALSHDERTVYFGRGTMGGSPDAALYAIDTETAALKWSFSAGTPNETYDFCSPVIGPDGVVYQQEEATGILYAVRDGGDHAEPLWSYGAGPPASEVCPRLPATSTDTVYVCVGSKICAVDFNGNERWKRDLGPNSACNTPLATPKAVYVGVENTGTLYALEPGSGEILWRHQFGRGPGSGLSHGLAIGKDGAIYTMASHYPAPGQTSIVALGNRAMAPVAYSPAAAPSRSGARWNRTWLLYGVLIVALALIIGSFAGVRFRRKAD